jgi:prepilin-type N-terminal cleavage/methylation domain-containing protein
MRRFAALEDGFTMVELMAALMILVVGILGAFIAFNASQRISLVSERHTAMTQMAQQAIESIEGLSYSDIGLECGGSSGNTCPQYNAADPTNPDHYVSSDGTAFQINRPSGASETLDINSINGDVAPVTPWTQASANGTLSGSIYEFVTWASDSQCSPGCRSSNGLNYKRITVAVTMTSGLQPSPVYVTSVIANPDAMPDGGVVDGSAGNPILSPNVNCQTGSGTTGPCTTGLGSGNSNTFFLHDWPATNSGSPTDPTADHATHPTVGVITGKTCTSNTALVGTPLDVNGCPIPDLMDPNPPSGDATTLLYNYSNDQCAVDSTCYPGGRELEATGQGTGTATDCNNGAWSATLLPNQSEMWVSPALSSSMTLTGAGGLTIYTQTLDNAAQNPVVSLCVQIYDVPPSGSAGSLADLIAYPPVAVGGAGYVGPTDPATHGNWPAAASQISFAFTFAQQAYTVPSGDRIGLRIWDKTNPSMPVDVIYDSPNYPSQLQLNSQ